MPTTFKININNDTAKWNAIREDYNPNAGWNPAPPAQIKLQENGYAELKVDAGYGTANFTYQSHSDSGSVTLQLQITESNEDKPIAATNPPGLIKATVKADKISTDKWIYQLTWKN